VFDEIDNKKSAKASGADSQPNLRRGDAAETAEFDYIDDWGDELPADSAGDGVPLAEITADEKMRRNAHGPVTRALDDFDAYLEDDDDRSADRRERNAASKLGRSKLNLSGSIAAPADVGAGGGAWGYDQPQVSGVFSRYDEETQDPDSGEFDLFEDEKSAPKPERTLRDVVSAHDKKIRRLNKQLAYQKEIIQVISELLVEARVISRHELKKRLRALRNKSS
jgi:hypothetical protein